MSIHIVCSNCKSKIIAKENLIGQTRNCPKCGTPILIQEEASNVSGENQVLGTGTNDSNESNLLGLKIPKLALDNIYVILGNDREIAYWKGIDGWFVNVGNGYESVKRAPEKLPDIGSFVLIEGYVKRTENGKRLKGIKFHQLRGRGVLDALKRNEADILRKVQEPISLTGSQKQMFLKHIRTHYFIEFTEGSENIIEYLTGYDSHSTEIGECNL